MDDSRPVREAAGNAFVSWVEDAPGDEGERDTADVGTRIWGELAVTATDAGRYDLRHRSDRGVSDQDLDARSVTDLHELVRYADDGRYRPFVGESTLPTGWFCSGLDRRELLRAVSVVYPASVEHWAAERTGDLDPVPFREVADRQTGIYECVADCSQAEVAGAVEACCENCTKRRTWDGEGGESLEDEGQIPCREPCSFLVAAAREFHHHEGAVADPEREPTASEEASTDDRPTESDASVPRGDLTDPANVYRVRYRRARDAAQTRTDSVQTRTDSAQTRPEP
nr:DR2241 family protein [Halorussus salinisoli]